MVFNVTFNNISVISWRSLLLVKETGVPGENHQPTANHWQTWSHNVVSSTPRLRAIRTHNVSGDRHYSGADPGFQVRGGALKKIAPSRGRRENFWDISCEKSRFYAKKSYFSNFRGGARNFWGISCEKSRFYAKKNHIFTNFRGGARAGCPPPWIRPCYLHRYMTYRKQNMSHQWRQSQMITFQ